MPELVIMTFDGTYRAHHAYNTIGAIEDFDAAWVDDIAVFCKAKLTNGSSMVLIADVTDVDQCISEFDRFKPASTTRHHIAERTLADLRAELSHV